MELGLVGVDVSNIFLIPNEIVPFPLLEEVDERLSSQWICTVVLEIFLLGSRGLNVPESMLRHSVQDLINQWLFQRKSESVFNVFNFVVLAILKEFQLI